MTEQLIKERDEALSKLRTLVYMAQALVNKNDEAIKAKRDCVAAIIEAKKLLGPITERNQQEVDG